MTIAVTHSTVADDSFSATGAAAWEANHTLSGVGTMAEQNANNVAITGGTISGITDLAVADGGTGASTAATARVNILPSYTGNANKRLTVNAGATDVEWVDDGGGTVTSVTGTAPVVSSGGTTPAISMAQATGSVNGYLSSTDWTTFNNKTSNTGTVTSVSGTGSVNGLSLSGTVTTSGNITLGGTLDLSAPPTIGNTTANTITGTTITASTAYKGTYYDANSSAGGNLRTSGGTACFQWGAGGGNNCTVDGSINMNGSNAHIDMSPTGTGHVSINPTGVGDINNVIIGATTPLAGSFTNLSVTGTTSFDGSQGTAGQVLTSAGTGNTPTWATPTTGTVTSVSGTAPIASSGGATPAISISQATTSTDGYLSSTDWNTFNNKQPSGSYLTTVTASTPLSGSGTVGSPIVISQATTSTNGYLSSTDWNTFNGKGSGTVTSVGGNGTVNGITLTGTVTSTGSLTLGGTLDLSAPPAIGGTTPNTGKFTTLTATSGISGGAF